ncbi:MAG: Clp protease ClpP [Rikenellaceae bacterium]
MRETIKIKNSQETTTIDIEGTIGIPEEWQFEDPQQRVTTYENFRRSLQQIEELQSTNVVVNIRSTGGDVGDALLIYDALVGLDAQITTRCWGYVASAATVIAQAASEGQREISSNALYLIHNSTCTAEGNATELSQRVELLRKSDERLAELYARRSGRDVESFVTLMGEEGGEGRWLSAKEAIEAGLADSEIATSTLAPEEESEESEESESVPEMVSETLESALTSVKGVLRKIGSRLRGADREREVATPVVSDTVSASVSASTESSASQIVFEERQRELTPTVIAQCEDPSLHEASMSANESAYLRDAQRMRR